MSRRGKKIRLKYKRHRVLLSDVLPFELPIIFSNRNFYRFCVESGLWFDINSNELIWDRRIGDEAFSVIKFMSAIDSEKEEGRAKSPFQSTLPCMCEILHKESSNRHLAVIHPLEQVKVCAFYDKYKELMLHYCAKSNFSIRKPVRMASYVYWKDNLHSRLLENRKSQIESFLREYESLRSFFAYKHYSNINKFYEDRRFQNAERRFGFLTKMDVQSCFDSIYTHSLCWATQGGKAEYKKNFSGTDQSSFGAVWDVLIRGMNYGETNGIVIGPEFSRIYSEIILQYVDGCVERDLASNFRLHEDYEIYRYVDDIFVFYNAPEFKKRVTDVYASRLKEFKLRINDSKTKHFVRPFITPITRAKLALQNIFDLMKIQIGTSDRSTEYGITDHRGEEGLGESMPHDVAKLRQCLDMDVRLKIVPEKINVLFKDLLADLDIDPKDILNYTLACVYTNIEGNLKKIEVVQRNLRMAMADKELDDDNKALCEKKNRKYQKMITTYLLGMIKTVFFMFSYCPRINMTLKVMRIINLVAEYMGGHHICDDTKYQRFDTSQRHAVFSEINHEIHTVFSKGRMDSFAQYEVLPLLVSSRDMTGEDYLSPEILMKYIGFDEEGHVGVYSQKLGVIPILILLYYCGNRNKYAELKQRIYEAACRLVRSTDVKMRQRHAETMLLAMDFACCPYLNRNQKAEFLTLYGLPSTEIKNIIDFGERKKCFFTKWNGFRLNMELSAKVGLEPYA